METTLAQIAHEVTGIDIANIRVVLGDTGTTPYSTGTYASRSIVMAGGAVANACKALVPRFIAIGAHLMQAAVGTVVRERRGHRAAEIDHAARGRRGLVSAPERLPPDVDLGGLETTVGFSPEARHRRLQLCVRTPPWWRSIPRSARSRSSTMSSSRIAARW